MLIEAVTAKVSNTCRWSKATTRFKINQILENYWTDIERVQELQQQEINVENNV